ncbi:uncharacterized protein LOC116258073 isoform X2 [Nymphaea colorata]|uniref:uncharacterized protein LOC116258073 isoform X2 n=1 Tax=Nymphaea colorata TaxID=210225 RepID=UPI00214E9628|nr:uncharacterized protein LOC116258073 isoform X2 [Nymphaea colorata]
MAARTKDVETGRKGGAPSSSSDAFSRPAQKSKSNPRPSLSSVAGSSPDRGATTGKHLPHYLRPTISSCHGRGATDTQVPAKATRNPAHPKSPSPSPSPSSSKSTSMRRKSYSTSTSPKEGSSKASNVPFSKTAVFSRSASTKILKPHERSSPTTTAAATKSAATKKIKGGVTSDPRKAVGKGNRDAAPTSGGEDKVEEKTMIIQEPRGTHVGKNLKNSVASDSLHVSSDQLTQTAAAATVNIASDDSNDPTDLKMAAFSKEQQAGTETFSPKSPDSNTEFKLENGDNEESHDKGKILDPVVQTKKGFDADASAINGDHDSGCLQKNEEAEEDEGNREQAEADAEGDSCNDPTDSFDRKQERAKETEDGERVAEPSTLNNGTPNAREGQELCRASVLSPTTEDGANKPRKLEFRRGNILSPKVEDDVNTPRKLEFRRGNTVSPKVEDDVNTPRKLEFRKGTVLSRKAEEDVNTPRKLEFRRGRAADKDNDQGGGQEKDGAVAYNQVIEETASKLVNARRSKVRALVGAFETVISIHETDAQSSQSHTPAPIPAVAPSSSDSGPASPPGQLPPSGSTPPPASVLVPVPDLASIPPPSPTSALNLGEDPSKGQEEEEEEEEEEADDKEGEEEKEAEEEEEEEVDDKEGEEEKEEGGEAADHRS